MRTIVISLFFTISLSAQNVWYVDRDATGANTGRSWADAWNTTDSVWGGGKGVNWELIQAGDTVYISGGLDSTRYGKVAGTSPSIRGDQFDPSKPNFTPQVVVTSSWEEGHNGEVWFYTEDSTLQYAFVSRDISGIKLININFMSASYSGSGNTSYHTTAALVEDNERITFENCTFTNTGSGAALGLGGSFNIIENCLIQTLTNNNTVDQDLLTMGGGKGGHIIRHSTIIQRSICDSTDAHPDFIQIGSWYGSDDYEETLFENNFMWQITPNRQSEYNAGIYISSGANLHKQRFTFINNIFIIDIPDNNYTGAVNGVPALWLRGYDGNDNSMYSLRLFNNTFIAPSASLLLTECDTLIAKNNIFIQTSDITNGNSLIGWRGYSAYQAAYLDVDYNHWFVKNWTPAKKFQVGDSFHAYGWADWKGLGYDNHGDTGYVNLVNVKDSVITAYNTETGRNAGIDLSALSIQYPSISYDILGNPRGVGGNWDLGALEYQGSASNNINVKCKLFLQGPFGTNSMSTNLSQNGLLPNTQPFNVAPWNYAGNENLGSAPTSGYVDWVLVELRNSANPTQVVSTKAAILKNDGSLLNTDGSIGVPFNNVLEGSYYVAVFQRNHLGIMSASPVQLSVNSPLYDFTNSMNKAYGTDPMADLGSGVYGMHAGDGNSNGGITISDRNEVWAPQNGTIGYLKGDFNLDGGVTASDVNLYWNINNGTMTQVP